MHHPPTLASLKPEPFHNLVRHFKFLSSVKAFGPPPSAAAEAWKGLARYRTADDADTKGRPLTEREKEYAKVTTVLDAPECDLTYYCDVAGERQDIPASHHLAWSDRFSQ